MRSLLFVGHIWLLILLTLVSFLDFHWCSTSYMQLNDFEPTAVFIAEIYFVLVRVWLFDPSTFMVDRGLSILTSLYRLPKSEQPQQCPRNSWQWWVSQSEVRLWSMLEHLELESDDFPVAPSVLQSHYKFKIDRFRGSFVIGHFQIWLCLTDWSRPNTLLVHACSIILISA